MLSVDVNTRSTQESYSRRYCICVSCISFWSNRINPTNPTTAQLATMVKSMRFEDLEVPVPGFGAMGISFALGNDLSYEQAEPVLLKALEQGCTFWDTAVRPH